MQMLSKLRYEIKVRENRTKIITLDENKNNHTYYASFPFIEFTLKILLQEHFKVIKRKFYKKAIIHFMGSERNLRK